MGKNSIFSIKTAVMMALVFAVVIVSAQFSGIISVLSPPMQTELKDGTVWWTTTLNVDSIGDGLEFFVYSSDMDVVTLDDGTDVVPTTAFNMYFNKNKNTCSYALIKDSQFTFFGMDLLPYYKLSNPTREVLIDIKDGKNNVLEQLDTTTEGEIIFYDVFDGKGEVVVKPQGILSGAKDCPESSNVVVVFKNNEPIYYDRIDFNEKREDITITSLLTPFKMQEIIFDFLSAVDKAEAFTKDFKNLEASEYNHDLSGEIDKLGSGVITVSVSEDFVDAMRFAPAEDVMPDIISIDLLDKIQTGTSGTMRVTIENEMDNTGIVGVTPTADFISFIPKSRQITLSTKNVVDFSFEAGKILQDTVTEICVDVVSSGSQFTGSNTDRLCKQITITKTANEVECGDGFCDESIGETYLTCATDCDQESPCVNVPNSSPDFWGNCVCNEGYTSVIKNGKLTCEEEKDYTALLILGAIAFVGFIFMLLIIVLALQFTKNK